jgi:LmbE family N-acetylglucosaminyl deacetylase
MLATRRDWSAKHERWQAGAPERFDPSAYAGRTVIVLAPHPDDEVIGAGGTLLRLGRAGARLVCVQATDGSAGAALARSPDAERREVRLREARRVADACAFADLQLWRVDNGNFRATGELVDRMAALLAKERPALVLVPFVTEAHEDHLTLSVILARALQRAPLDADARVFGYEVWSLVPANVVHDVTSVMEEVESLLFLYDVAMRIDDFVHFCADRALYHAWGYESRPAYLEAFHAVKASDYEALLRTVRPDTA